MDPDWGWIDGHGQQVRISSSRSILVMLKRMIQWWDTMQQTNRPSGILFENITNGIIAEIKIYKV
jgi:hypothetical protein